MRFGVLERGRVSRRGDRAAVLRAAVRAGCTIDKSGRHIIIKTPGGHRIVASGSPSDVNADHNLKKDLRRAGVELEV